MTLPVRYEDGELALEVAESQQELRLVWRGKSNAREPGRFLVPVLTETHERARAGGRRLVLDFSPLDYMNSSTFTPIVKLLDQVKRTGGSITLVFDPSRKWQALSFGALRTFETPDGRIAVHGK